jgi:hypothetical protein
MWRHRNVTVVCEWINKIKSRRGNFFARLLSLSRLHDRLELLMRLIFFISTRCCCSSYVYVCGWYRKWTKVKDIKDRRRATELEHKSDGTDGEKTFSLFVLSVFGVWLGEWKDEAGGGQSFPLWSTECFFFFFFFFHSVGVIPRRSERRAIVS